MRFEDSTIRKVQLSQGIIQYREAGEGDAIVFIHGALVNGTLWRKVVPLLSPHYRCIVPDLPLGSHTTPMNADADVSPPGLARLIAEFLAALNLQRVTLVGNDTGGALCQLVVTAHPERIARLVLTNCDAFENFPPKAFVPLMKGAYLPGFLFVLAQMLRLEMVRRSPIAFGWLSKKPLVNAILDVYLKPMIENGAIRRDLGKVLRGVSSKYTLDAAKQLVHCKIPVLLAWAQADRFFKIKDAERLQRIIPSAELKRIDDSLTFVPEDQPEQLAQLIREFIAAHPASVMEAQSRLVANV